MILRFSLLGVIVSILGGLFALGAESTLDTGKIKIIAGRDGGGFIDEAWLDLNGDGRYEDSERILLRPQDQPGFYLAYTQCTKNPQPDEIAIGPQVLGKEKVDSADVQGMVMSIRGHLDFGALGGSPFEVVIRVKKGSSAIAADLSFSPLKSHPECVLREVSLRVHEVFEVGEPDGKTRYMSSGEFRNTPRPKTAYQPMCFQLGGQRVESPWQWQEWVSWSEDTGPVNVKEGYTPPRELSFYMRDLSKGVHAFINEPAGVAPVELSGSGLPTYVHVSILGSAARCLSIVLLDKLGGDA